MFHKKAPRGAVQLVPVAKKQKTNLRTKFRCILCPRFSQTDVDFAPPTASPQKNHMANATSSHETHKHGEFKLPGLVAIRHLWTQTALSLWFSSGILQTPTRVARGTRCAVVWATETDLRSGEHPMFPLVTSPNIRTSTHHSHNRCFRPAGQRCARRTVLVRSIERRTGVSCNISPLPLVYTLKSRYFLPPFQNQDETGHFGGVQNKVWLGSKSKVEADTDRGHDGGGVRRVRMLIHICCWENLSRAAALGQKSANLAQALKASIAVLTATGPNLLNHRSS